MMNLARLAERLEERGQPVRLVGHGDVVPRRACFDSRRVRAGDLFCALPGQRTSGERYLAAARAAGAVAVLAPQGGVEPGALPALLAADAVSAAGHAAALLAGEPAASLWLAAVTGTNGKTTVAWLVRQALEAATVPTAVLGTLGTLVGERCLPLDNTTPAADVLQEHLEEARVAGARAAVIEASSHGLDQGRLAGLAPDAGAWTNLTQDHLDYHLDLDDYARAKGRLAGLLPADAPFFVPAGDRRIGAACAGSGARLVTWSVDGAAELTARRSGGSGGGVVLDVHGEWGPARIESRLVGGHNAENLLVAYGLLRAAGLQAVEAARALAAGSAPPGRLERVAGDAPWLLYVDYAHTPDALARALAALRDAHPGRRLGVVFGAGGDRDPHKRAPMGRAAAGGADWCLVTSDNPRHEDPGRIAAAVACGVTEVAGEAEVVLDRRQAIALAVQRLQPGEVLLVAGKGHEPYQEVAGVRHPFDDRLVLAEAAACST